MAHPQQTTVDPVLGDDPDVGAGHELNGTPDGASAEEIHVRNYDFERAYEVAVRVEDASGNRLFSRRYFLRPGQSRSERDVLDAGRYRVTAAIDPPERDAIECSVGSAPEHTALVEVGNGAVSVSEGLYR